MRMRSPDRRKGTSLAELPVNLWVFVFILLLPFIDFVTMGYRLAFAYFGVRDATYKAALQTTFTSALSMANATLNTDSAAWSGVGYSSTSVYVVQIDSSGNVEADGGANSPWPATPVPSSDGSNNPYVYLIRVTTTASATPLLNMGASGSWKGSVPGLTSPLSIQLTYQIAAENPQGLNQ